MPAKAHPLAHVQRSHLRPCFRNRADNLMAGYEWILADAPVVRNQVNIAVADAAVGHGYLHLLRAQLAWVVVIGQKFCASRVRCKSLNLTHDRFAFLTCVGETKRLTDFPKCASPKNAR